MPDHPQARDGRGETPKTEAGKTRVEETAPRGLLPKRAQGKDQGVRDDEQYRLQIETAGLGFADSAEHHAARRNGVGDEQSAHGNEAPYQRCAPRRAQSEPGGQPAFTKGEKDRSRDESGDPPRDNDKPVGNDGIEQQKHCAHRRDGDKDGDGKDRGHGVVGALWGLHG